MKNKIIKISVYILGIILMISIPAACHFYKVSGETPNSDMKEKFSELSNYNENGFSNLSRKSLDWSSIPITKMIKDYLNKPKTVTPSKQIPSIKSNLDSGEYLTPTIFWFGHSSYLIKYKNYNILIDPVLCGYAAPFSFLVNAYDGANIYSPEDLPEIDLLLITHDHYDHLDYNTIMPIKDRIKKIITPLGVDSHLKYWGIDTAKISTLNWYDNIDIDDTIRVTAAPSQHFSGRSLSRNQTLWASFILQLDTFKLFLGADGGYSKEFKKIGEKYGPFDLALLENGQYNEKWHLIHCYPEETAQAGIDLRAKLVQPIHWAKFSLAMHPWNEPIKRFIKMADSLKLNYSVPKIGQAYSIGGTEFRTPWWDFE